MGRDKLVPPITIDAWSLGFGDLSRLRRVRHDSVDCSFQFLELNRLYQMLRETSAQASLDITVHAKPADGDATDGRHRSKARHQFHPGAIRQRDVANDQIEFVTSRRLHGRTNILGCGDKVTAANKQTFERGAGVLMIVKQ
jgi:hypothetical protein